MFLIAAFDDRISDSFQHESTTKWSNGASHKVATTWRVFISFNSFSITSVKQIYRFYGRHAPEGTTRHERGVKIYFHSTVCYYH